MFIIDFSSSQSKISSFVQKRDEPAWAAPVFDFINLWMDGAVKNFAIHTSGSTGTPREIYHSREAMTASAERTCDFFDLKTGDTALLALPATHIGGRMMIVRSMVRRLKLICIEPKPDPLADNLFPGAGTIDLAAFTPMQMSIILSGPSCSGLNKIKTIILGGGEVSPALNQRLQDIKTSVYETYGMTETISHLALKKINGADRSDCFTLLDGVSVSLDERGCLVIDAPYLSADKIITNDIVQVIDGKRFKWTGRYDNVINTGGIKVPAEEIERKLRPHMDVNFFITAAADETLGRKVALVVETDGVGTNAESKYTEIINTHLTKYEKPRLIKAVQPFIYTATGKINRKETLKKIAAGDL